MGQSQSFFGRLIGISSSAKTLQNADSLSEGSHEGPPLTELDDDGEGISSPIKKPLRPPVAGHSRDEIAERLYPSTTFEVKSEDMWQLLGYPSSERFTPAPPSVPTFKDPKTETPYVSYLNQLSDYVYDRILSGGPAEKIQFIITCRNKPKDHPTGSQNMPDFAAVMLKKDGTIPPYCWSLIEATGELKSNSNKDKVHRQSASYTGYLLQARPDRIAVLGIFVQKDSFRLTYTNCFGAFSTPLMKWKGTGVTHLLCAWIRKLYEPDVDRTITPSIDPDSWPVFSVVISSQDNLVYENCHLQNVNSSPFDRRTTIFKTKDESTVIKEQYIETGRRYLEGPILMKIHCNGTFPGVVRSKSHGVVQSNNNDIVVNSCRDDIKRMKTRVVLMDTAGSIMEAETPLDFLIAIYDLLEVTRFLYKKHKILHRDISSENVRLRRVSEVYNDSPDPDMCFASYLLQETLGKTGVCRLDTRILLIDFDMSEDQNQEDTEPQSKSRKPRTGTPIFMARLVRAGRRTEGIYTLPAIPNLTVDGREVYAKHIGNRLNEFPDNKNETIQIESPKFPEPFCHRLRYDAESTFWLIMWWLVLAAPEGKPLELISSELWHAITSSDGIDFREQLLRPGLPNILHTVYEPLMPLLQGMAKQLTGDHETSTDPLKQKEDYLHEVFQRMVFTFIHENHSKPYMTTKKSSTPRSKDAMKSMNVPWSQRQIDLSRRSTRSLNSSIHSTSVQGDKSLRLKDKLNSIRTGNKGKRSRGSDDEQMEKQKKKQRTSEA